MLYVSKVAAVSESQDRVDEIVIPDARGSDKHADGSGQVAHVCQMLVMVHGKPDRTSPLFGMTVSIIAANEAGTPGVGHGFAAIPPLHDMVNAAGLGGVKRNFDASRVACTITMTGGTVTADVPSFEVELPRHGATAPHPKGTIPIVGTWTSNVGKTGVLLVKNNKGELVDHVDLVPATEVYIYNWDVDWNDPTKSQLTQPGNKPTKPYQDDDFKWIYQLLDPTLPMTWKEWLPTGTYFPAPRSINFSATPNKPAPSMGSLTGSCNAARVRGLG